MSYNPHLIGSLTSEDNVLVGGDTCHSTMGALKSDEVYLSNVCTEGTRIGALNTGLEAIYLRDEPLDALDLRDCVVPHVRQDDWSSMTFIGNAITMDASGCDCESSTGDYWSYDFTEYQTSNGDTYWYVNSNVDIFGTGNWWLDAGYSWIAHIAGASPYFEVYVNCVGADYLVWSGTKSCGHDPDGAYTRTGGCDTTDPFIWNKV